MESLQTTWCLRENGGILPAVKVEVSQAGQEVAGDDQDEGPEEGGLWASICEEVDDPDERATKIGYHGKGGED